MFDHEYLAQAEELHGNDAVMEFINHAYDHGEVVHGRLVKYSYNGLYVHALVLPYTSQYTMVGPIVEHLYQHTRDLDKRLLIVRNPAWEEGRTSAHAVSPV